MSTPANAPALKAAIPHAVDSCFAWLQERLAPLMRRHGAIDTIALLSKATTGDPYCFPVAATEDGIVCRSRSTSGLPGATTHIWLGYGRVYGDRTDLRLVDPMPFHGWGEHTDLIADMMRNARVALEEPAG